jgi:glycerol-3-phosphate dehydrogenase
MYDVLIIGGGITGAGLLRDLSLRGFKALLVEKGRPAMGTTANSSHLIHGGLRYLLYDRLTTHTTCWDSGRILRIARPLLTRLPLLWPVYRGHAHGLETVETLLREYDRFSAMKGGLRHLRLTAEETLRLFPGLKPEGLLGAVSFDEWWVDPESLVRANLDAGLREGGDVRLGVEATALEREGGRVTGVRLRDGAGVEHSVRARVVVNAAGPWADRVARLAGLEVPLRLRQGVHLVYDRPIPALRTGAGSTGLLLQAPDGRYVFVLPHGDVTLVGPTDVATDRGPDALLPTEEEKAYLFSTVKGYLADFPARHDRALVGARPILGRAGPEKLLSREFELFNHAAQDAAGFLTLAGGKMSDFRLMAETAADAVCGLLGRYIPCLTHRVDLEGRMLPDVRERALPPGGLKAFLRAHPRLREAHAWGHLALGYVRHVVRNPRQATAEDFARHYA